MSKAKFQEQATKILENFEYTCLAKTDKLEAWRCQQPDTCSYAFDIMVSRFGIAIIGDMDTLTFRVGSSYGIPFLAGNDVAYYIRSKLEQQSMETEFDAEAYLGVFKQHLASFLSEEWEDMLENNTFASSIDTNLPEWAFNEEAIQTHSTDEIDSLLSQIDEIASEIGSGEPVNTLQDLYCDNEWQHIESDSEARELIERVFEDEDSWEYSFRKTTSNLMQRLYLVNHAAKQIMKIKEAQNA